ncbi:hypothetical protein [Halobacteriovorax sp. RZ-2]|uniref:hypothetical protein n=1 Tax=unclassified Halobacteriovorax TaxID=2639665 RepID=UPI003716549A
MKKLLLASALFMGAFSTQAARVQFDFDVYSSGASIYPCNAGLKHKKHRGVFCYNPKTLRSCDPGSRGGHGGYPFLEGLIAEGGNGGYNGGGGGQDCGPDGTNCDCVCAGDLDGRNENTLDTVRGKITKWKDHGDRSNFRYSVEKTAGEYNYHTLIDQNDQFSKRLKELSFNLGSEMYGAKYFVDICFRATQIDYGQKPDYLTESTEDRFDFIVPDEIRDDYVVGMPESFGSIDNPLYKFERKVTVTDLAGSNTSDHWDLGEDDTIWSEESYQSAARLAVKSGIFCKDKDGDYVQVYGGSGNPSAQIDLSSNSVVEFFKRFAAADLKGCVVRYEFEENARYAHKTVDKFRRWKMQAANICTDTAITNIQGHDHDYDY